MAYTKSSLSPRFRFNLHRPSGEYDGIVSNNIPEYFSFADNTDYQSITIPNGGVEVSGDVTQMKALIKVISPSGIVLYSSPNYDSPVWSSYDFGGSSQHQMDGDMDLVNLLQLPLNSAGTVQKGDYIVKYKTYNGSVTVETVWILGICCYATPTGVIDMTFDCATSTLQSSDNTAYGNYLTSVARSHTLVAPTGSTYDIGTKLVADSTENKVITATANIWTKVWQSTLVSDFVMTYPATSGSDQYEVYDRISIQDSINVTCDSGLNYILRCYKAMHEKCEAYRTSGNKAMVESYEKKLGRLNLCIQLYELARTGGAQYADIMADEKSRIDTILAAEGCGCETQDSYTAEIIPSTTIIYSGGGSGGMYIDLVMTAETGEPGTDVVVEEVPSAAGIQTFNLTIPRGAQFVLNSTGIIGDSTSSDYPDGVGISGIHLLNPLGEELSAAKKQAFILTDGDLNYFHLVTTDNCVSESINDVNGDPIAAGGLGGHLIAWNGLTWISYGLFTSIPGPQGVAGNSIQVHKNSWGTDFDDNTITPRAGDILITGV